LGSLIKRTICKHGIYLSTEVTDMLGWNIGDEITVNNIDGNLVIKLSKRYNGPRCVICNKPEQKVVVNGREICDDCVRAIKSANSPKVFLGSLGMSGSTPPPP